VAELRDKSFEDLHSLWWASLLELNRILTQRAERERLEAGYGAYESDEREKTVRQTMKAIRHSLTERWYSWEEARKLAREDPEVDLSGDGPAYNPNALEEVDIEEEGIKEKASG
jgi:large subunit ribosomal protein L47